MEKFEVLEKIGEGQFGKVHKGRMKFTGQIVALKFISKHCRSEKEMETLRSEVRILRKLHHPNIILMLDSFETAREYCVVTEYAQGELYQVLEEDKQLAEPDIQSIAKQLVRALDFLHSNRVIHRDMKPQNILISAQGVIKLCDFGFARSMSTATIMVKSIKGTPLYMAPELVQETPYNHTADLWSLGVILYELFTGYPPFYAKSIIQLIGIIVKDEVKYPPNMSPVLKQFLQGLLTKDKDKRLSWPNLRHHIFVSETEEEKEAREKALPSTLTDPRRRLDMFLATKEHTPRPFQSRKNSAPPMHRPGNGTQGIGQMNSNGVARQWSGESGSRRPNENRHGSLAGHQRRKTVAGSELKAMMGNTQNTTSHLNGDATLGNPNRLITTDFVGQHANGGQAGAESHQVAEANGYNNAAEGQHSVWTATMVLEWDQLERHAQNAASCTVLRGDKRFTEKLFQVFQYNSDFVFREGEVFLCAALRTLAIVATKGEPPARGDDTQAQASDVVMHPHLLPTMLYLLNRFYPTRPSGVIAEVVRAIRMVYRERLALMLTASGSLQGEAEQRYLVDVSIQMVGPLAKLLCCATDVNLTVNAQALKCLGVVLGHCSSDPTSCREVYRAMAQHCVPQVLCRCTRAMDFLNPKARPESAEKLGRFATHAIALLVHPQGGCAPQVLRYPLAYPLNDHDEYHSDVSLWHGGIFSEGSRNMLRDRTEELAEQARVGIAIRAATANALCVDDAASLNNMVELLEAQQQQTSPENESEVQQANETHISRLVLTHVILQILTQACDSQQYALEQNEKELDIAQRLVSYRSGAVIQHALAVIQDYWSVLWEFEQALHNQDVFNTEVRMPSNDIDSVTAEHRARDLLQERMSPNRSSNASLAMMFLASLLRTAHVPVDVVYNIHHAVLACARFICTCSAILEEESEHNPDVSFDRNGCLLILPSVCCLLSAILSKFCPEPQNTVGAFAQGLVDTDDDGAAKQEDDSFENILDKIVPRETMIAIHRLLMVLCDNQSQTTPYSEYSGEAGAAEYWVNGSAYGIRHRGLADPAVELMLQVLKVAKTAGRQTHSQVADTMVELGLLDLILERVRAGRGNNEFSPRGLLAALDVMYELVSVENAKHLRILLSDGGNPNNGCAGLVPVLELLHASHLNRLVTWPRVYGGDVEGLDAVVHRVVRLAELPFLDSSKISEREVKLVQVTLYERRLVRRLIRALAYSTSENFTVELMESIFDLIARLVIHSSPFARQFVDSGGIAMVKCLGMLQFTIGSTDGESQGQRVPRRILSQVANRGPHIGEITTPAPKQCFYEASTKMIKNTLMILSQLARTSNVYYDKLLAADFNVEWRSLLGHSDPVLRSKTCNLIGNVCRHSDLFYRTLVKPLPPAPAPLFEASKIFPKSLLPSNTARHDLLFHVVSRAQDVDDETRRFASFAIGNAAYYSDFLYPDIRCAIALLVRLLEDVDDKTRANAAGGLGNLVRNSGALCRDILECGALQTLVTMAEEEPSHHQRRALYSIGNLCAYQSCRMALLEIKSPSFRERMELIRSRTNDQSTIDYVARVQEKLARAVVPE